MTNFFQDLYARGEELEKNEDYLSKAEIKHKIQNLKSALIERMEKADHLGPGMEDVRRLRQSRLEAMTLAMTLVQVELTCPRYDDDSEEV